MNAVTLTAAEVAARVQGEVSGDPEAVLTGIAAAENAGAGDLTFADSAAHFAAAEQSGATAIFVSKAFASTTKVLIRVADLIATQQLPEMARRMRALEKQVSELAAKLGS